jgi:hypothetical protein
VEETLVATSVREAEAITTMSGSGITTHVIGSLTVLPTVLVTVSPTAFPTALTGRGAARVTPCGGTLETIESLTGVSATNGDLSEERTSRAVMTLIKDLPV